MAPRIAIIGGGPAGLTCARILQLHGLHATIYEYEKSAASRSQGGSLDLHADSGMLAVIASGLEEQFKAKARPEGDQVRILDKDGKVFLDTKPDDKAEGQEPRPEIDRAQLREIFLESLDEGTIQWGRKLVRVETTDDGDGNESVHSGTHTLVFEDGVTEQADLVIGADGAWSKVRPLLSDKTPTYTGVTFVECVIENVDNRFPNLASLCGHGICLMLSFERGLVAQRNSGGVIRIYATLNVEEGWAKKEFAEAASRGGSESVRRLLLSFFQGWNPELLDFIAHCDEEPAIWARPIYALPVDHEWRSKPGVTLVGDAAHVMTPFAGEGANIAMLDGLELAMAIADAWKVNSSVESLWAAIPSFEQAMFHRANRSSSFSANNQILAFNERAPHDFLEKLVATMAGEGRPQGNSTETGFASLSASWSSCGTGNPIDDCWRCDKDWESHRQALASCAMGFGRGAIGGRDWQIYSVTSNDDDNTADPQPGTLHHAATREEPLWIVFARSMTIYLHQELILTSFKTIDGRGVGVHIAGGAGLTLQRISNVIVHGIHIHDIKVTGPARIMSNETHAGQRGVTDGDAINIYTPEQIWIDHCSFANSADGLIDAIRGSSMITVSNNQFANQNKVMLFGAHSADTEDKEMQVTVAFNNFGAGLTQRMHRCRFGTFHVVNNYYPTGWAIYAIGGSEDPAKGTISLLRLHKR